MALVLTTSKVRAYVAASIVRSLERRTNGWVLRTDTGWRAAASRSTLQALLRHRDDGSAASRHRALTLRVLRGSSAASRHRAPRSRTPSATAAQICPFAARVWLALLETGLPFSLDEVSIKV